MADPSQDVRPGVRPDARPAAPAAQPPAGRYGRRDEQAARRRGKRIYYVAVGLAVAVVAAVGAKYVLGSSVNGEVQTFQVVSDHEVDITLTVSKPADQAASCTLRSRDADGNEVGRITVPVPEGSGDTTTTVRLRTTARGTTGELVNCS